MHATTSARQAFRVGTNSKEAVPLNGKYPRKMPTVNGASLIYFLSPFHAYFSPALFIPLSEFTRNFFDSSWNFVQFTGL